MKIVIAEKYKHLSDFIRTIPQGNTPVEEVIRDHRNILTKVTVGGKTYVVKQYIRPRFYNRIAYSFLRKSKARRSYEYALELLRRGIGTAEPVAYIEIRKGGLFHTGYFVSEFIDEPLLYRIGNHPDSREILDQFARFTANLHEQGILHHDYNPQNVLYRKEGEKYHFSIIDINRMNFRKKTTQRQCLTTLIRMGFEEPRLGEYIHLYAQKRGWQPEETVKRFYTLRDNFEQRRKVKQRLRNKEK